MPRELLSNKLWWEGPEWLSLSPQYWPIRLDIGDPPIDVNQPSPVPILTTRESEPDVVCRFSSFFHLSRFYAYAMRWLQRVRKKSMILGPVTIQEIRFSKLAITVTHQKLHFAREYELLAHGKTLPTWSPLVKLNAFLGKDRVIHITGRLHHAQISILARTPILLKGKSHLVKIILQDIHRLYAHASARVMMAVMSETHYVVGLRSLARLVAHECAICRRINSIPCTQKMGQLPASRVTYSPAFAAVAVDYAGPFQVRRGAIRHPTIEKGYVAVFVCLCSKAVHLELVSDLSTDAFLAALRRFISRRGRPRIIYSDNGTNFVGASKEIHRLLRDENARIAVMGYTKEQGIDWKFSPVQSPHHGGLWEAAVREMKRTMFKILGPNKLPFEHLVTLLHEAEATLNSRPIVPFDTLHEDGCPALTPAHFLVGRSLLTIPEQVETNVKLNGLKRWTLLKTLNAQIQQRWLKEYLHSHHIYYRWKKAERNLQVGDIVGLRESGFSKQRIPMAKVIQVYPGVDGLVRVVKLYTGKEEIKRAVQRLVLLLPVDDFTSRTTQDADSVSPGMCSGQPSQTEEDKATE